MENKINKIKTIEDYAKSLPELKFAHGFDHVDRVRNWILKIAQSEKYPKIELAEATALLHDVGRSNTNANDKRRHGEIGADMAKKFLIEKRLFSTDEIDDIFNAIRYHDVNRQGNGQPLAMLRDADILDLLGAIGILRGAMGDAQLPIFDPKNIKGKNWGFSVLDFNEIFDSGKRKGEALPDQINFQISCFGNLKTDYAKKIARPMVKVMQDFLIQLEKEAEQN